MGRNSIPPAIRDWLVTGGLSVALIGGAFLWRDQQSAPAPPPANGSANAIDIRPLPRTRKLVKQKIGSLEAYNQVIPQADQLREFSYWTKNRPVDAAAFEEMSRLMVDRIVPDLWREAQRLAGDSKMVTHQAMSHVVHSRWPQTLLPNGHVILFPGHARLRLVASERMQDYFRDTGWHWRWIGQAIDKQTIDLSKAGELDIYAAEELSEFLSVLAVGILEWSASLHQPPLPEGIRITDSVMKRTLALMQTHAQNSMGAAWRSIWR